MGGRREKEKGKKKGERKSRSETTAPLPRGGVWCGVGKHRQLPFGGSRAEGTEHKKVRLDFQSDLRRTAAAYSPTWWGSTIGDGGLNFSVRNGKRWYPAAIATAIYYLREIIQRCTYVSDYAFSVCSHTLSALQLQPFGLFFLLRKDFGLLVQVD